MKEIKLSNSSLVAFVDDEDFERVNALRWRLSWSDQYAIRTLNYYPEGVPRKFEYRKQGMLTMHSFILGPTPEGKQIDHKNRNRLDNRKENLRFATHKENQRNSTRKANKFGFRGVSLQHGAKTWRARLCVDGKRIEVGGFKTAREAAVHYNKLAREYHGDFAVLNEV